MNDGMQPAGDGAPLVVVADEHGIGLAAALIRRGAVVAFPTETAYGLAVDGLCEQAVVRLAAVKGRAERKHFSLLVADEAMLSRVVSQVPDAARALISRHWPGPLTLVLPAAGGVPGAVVNPDGGVGVRMSSDRTAAALVRAVGAPLTATSANRSGQAPATTARAAALTGVALVLDDGERASPVSTVVQVLDDGVPVVLRSGPVEIDLAPAVDPGAVPGARGEETTVDDVCRGEIVVEQPRAGYRFNIDAVVVARFAAEVVREPPRQVIDLGAGCGVVGLLLGRRWPDCQLTLVEIQPEMAELCRRNAVRNRRGSRTRVVAGDLRRVQAWQPRPVAETGRSVGTLVVCNPPFHPVGSGRASPRADLAAARHELCCTLEALVGACGKVLEPGAELVLIHLATRESELLDALSRHGLAAHALRRVSSLPGKPPSRLLVAARSGVPGRAARELPPLVIGESPGRYSEEVRRMLNEPSDGR